MLLAGTLNELGDVLTQQDHPGDAEEALKCYARCIEITEALLRTYTNPMTVRNAAVLPWRNLAMPICVVRSRVTLNAQNSRFTSDSLLLYESLQKSFPRGASSGSRSGVFGTGAFGRRARQTSTAGRR